jgi:hypothetical protein
MHQIRICPLHYQYQEYAELLFEELSQAGIPCRLDPWQAHGAALRPEPMWFMAIPASR